MRFLLCLCLVNFATAQTFQITEISPHKQGDQEEWFEFVVSGEEAFDLAQYQVSNGKNKPKPLSEALVGAETGYYYFKKSPVSLANDGGTIQILDLEGNILTEAIYPKTKSGTKAGEKWIEIWNWSEDFQKFIPIIDQITPGKLNLKLPTPADQFELLFSEASPDKDFLEFYLKRGPKKTNLKYTRLKHNGTTMRHFEIDFWIEPGEFILVEGAVSGGSGTVEVITHSGTSLEHTEDVACWQDETLSKTESARVDKFQINETWSGPCYGFGESIKNESIARMENFADTNTASDFWRHYNGSPGGENQSENQPPQAAIVIQGSGKKVSTPPFSINLTGESSTDPDGEKDLRRFRWYLNEKLISERSNPLSFKLTALGEYLLELQVEDYSGAISTATEIFYVTPTISAPSAGNSQAFQAHLAAAIEASAPKALSLGTEDFFGPVLANQAFMQRLYELQLPPPVYPDYEEKDLALAVETSVIKSKRRIQLPLIVRQRLKKNLGLIWDWRETPWAGAVGSTSDGAIDQNSERFAVVFGVP